MSLEDDGREHSHEQELKQQECKHDFGNRLGGPCLKCGKTQRDLEQETLEEQRRLFASMEPKPSFVKNAIRTEAPITPAVLERMTKCARLIHAAMGKATEIGEFIDDLKRHIFYGKELDIVNMLVEIGDGHWYDALAADFFGEKDFDRLQTMIIDKLKVRFPDKFSEHEAINRDLDAERKEVEKIEPTHPNPSSDFPLYEKEKMQMMPTKVSQTDDPNGVLDPLEKPFGYLIVEDKPEKYNWMIETKNNPNKFGMTFNFNLSDKEDWVLAREIKKLVYHTEKYKGMYNSLEQKMISFTESQPPLKASKL